MKFQVPLIAVLVLLFSSVWSVAQDFSLSTPVVSDDQVLNSGVAVVAIDFSGASATINGVDFSGAWEDFDEALFTSEMSNDEASISTISDDFESILSVGLANTRGSGQITLSGLTAGDTYELQLFAGGPSEDDNSETFSVDSTSSGNLVFGGEDGSGIGMIVETFVAGDDGGESIDLSSLSGMVELNALNLRDETTDVSDPAAAPEPATWVLLIAGALLMRGTADYFRQFGRTATS
jgi:hypothetical protein